MIVVVRKIKRKRSSGADKPVLTARDLVRIQSDQEKDARLIEQIQHRMQSRVSILEAAKLIEFVVGRRSRGHAKKARKVVPAILPQKLVIQPRKTTTTIPPTTAWTQRVKARQTWTSEMRKILAGLTAGVSHQELLTATAKSGLPRSKGDKGFYTAVVRLTKTGELIKSGGLLYSQKLADELQERGQALPVRVGARGGSSSIVLGILNEHPQGLSGPEIKDLAAKHPDSPRSMREHDQYIYNVLGGLKNAGAILKMDNGKYRLATPHAGGGTH